MSINYALPKIEMTLSILSFYTQVGIFVSHYRPLCW